LKSDTRFFSLLGSDDVKVSFLRKFIALMCRSNPSFGKGCYVDSAPLPNDIDGNPFNALCCHGVDSSEVMARLVLVLDGSTGMPVWYDVIPGNVLDLNTVMNTVNDVAGTLGIIIDSLVLDAGYISKPLLEAFHIGTDKTVIGRMPARKGYPYRTLYGEVKELVGKGKYEFVRGRHAYFGFRKEVEILGQMEHAYVYVDHFNALKRFTDYLTGNSEDYEKLSLKDKDWQTVRFGYLVLVSNICKSPKDLLSDYFSRTSIESVFKTCKDYLDLLPLSKWTDSTVRGKILYDIIGTIGLLQLRKSLSSTAMSTTEMFGKTQSLMCSISKQGMITIETPNKQVKEHYGALNVEIPAHLDVSSYKKKLEL